MASHTRSGTCLKCGRAGHWSRDCTIPRSEWHKTTEGVNTEAEGLPGLGSKKRKPKPKPKLDYELLMEGEAGVPKVLHNIAAEFRKQFKGKGHEGGDLRRLLQLYQHWQHSLYPYKDFDDFLQRVEKIGHTNMVKKRMRELRNVALEALEPEKEPPEETIALDVPDGADKMERVVVPKENAEPGAPSSQNDDVEEFEELDNTANSEELFDMLEE